MDLRVGYVLDRFRKNVLKCVGFVPWLRVGIVWNLCVGFVMDCAGSYQVSDASWEAFGRLLEVLGWLLEALGRVLEASWRPLRGILG